MVCHKIGIKKFNTGGNLKVLVGMSGGVDSSVAALILKQQGHEVIGATMSIWGKGGMAKKSGHKNACYGPDEIEDIAEAERIAEQLDIPYYVFNCVEQYEKIVLENFKNEYLNGRTPNPCVWCNALVKFGALPLMARENGIDFDKFATGHYARIEKKNDRYLLKRGIAEKKDQSYFLYRLKQEQLKDILLPLGTYTKDNIRQIAEENNLKVAFKPDSQDFYDGDYNELLNTNPQKGNIVDTDGRILGEHNGFWNYTVGQRKGLNISSTAPLYVLRTDKDKNEVIVGFRDKTLNNKLTATNLNWIAFDNPPQNINCTAKIRSSQQPQDVIVRYNSGTCDVEFLNFQQSVSVGQSIVFYNEDTLLGGGIIDKIIK